MIGAAIACVFTFWLVELLDFDLLGGWSFTRPIVCGPIAGLLLGDLQTGLMMGAAIEAVYMGISNIGGAMAADPCSSTIIAVAFSITTGASMEQGIALSLPIGAVMQSITNFMNPFLGYMAGFWENLAKKGDTRKFTIAVLVFQAFFQHLVQNIALFIGVAYGINGLESLINILPTWIMTGFGAAAGIMTAVGMAILLSMIWSNELGGYFFVGFILAKYLNLPILPIAILMGVIAIAYYFNYAKKQTATQAEAVQTANNGEDFF